MALSLKDIFEVLDALSDQERVAVRQYLDRTAGSASGEPLSTLLATWDESITIEDAEELNRLIRESRRSKAEPPRLELTE
jgi:hypothetical protein